MQISYKNQRQKNEIRHYVRLFSIFALILTIKPNFLI